MPNVGVRGTLNPPRGTADVNTGDHALPFTAELRSAAVGDSVLSSGGWLMGDGDGRKRESVELNGHWLPRPGDGGPAVDLLVPANDPPTPIAAGRLAVYSPECFTNRAHGDDGLSASVAAAVAPGAHRHRERDTHRHTDTPTNV